MLGKLEKLGKLGKLESLGSLGSLEDRIKGKLASLMLSMMVLIKGVLASLMGAMSNEFGHVVFLVEKNSKANFLSSVVFLTREATAWALKEDMVMITNRGERRERGG